MDGEAPFRRPSHTCDLASGGRPVVPAGGGAVRRQRELGDPLGGALAGDRRNEAAYAGRRPVLASEAAPRAFARPDRRAAGSDAEGDSLGAQGVGDRGERRDGLTVPRRGGVSFKKTEFAAEQPALDPRPLVFIDESRAKTNMTRTCGRAPRGERLIARMAHGHCKSRSSWRHCAATASRRRACSMARSTRSPSPPMSNSSWRLRSSPAISSA